MNSIKRSVGHEIFAGERMPYRRASSRNNLVNGSIDRYCYRIAISFQNFERTRAAFLTLPIPEIFGENQHQIETADRHPRRSVTVHSHMRRNEVGASLQSSPARDAFPWFIVFGL